jgi:hypothetical protein
VVAAALGRADRGERPQRADLATSLPVRAAIAAASRPYQVQRRRGQRDSCARAAIAEHRRATLRWWPERRVVHAVRLDDAGWWGNVHAQVRPPERALADLGKAAHELLGWAGAAPRVVLGGDMNLRDPAAPGLAHLGGHHIDHVLGRGWRRVGAAKLDAGALSDHPPVLVELAPAGT